MGSVGGLSDQRPYLVLLKVKVLVALFNPADCSSPGPSVRGIFQARILEWVAIPFSGGPSRPRDPTCLSRIASVFFTIILLDTYMYNVYYVNVFVCVY